MNIHHLGRFWRLLGPRGWPLAHTCLLFCWYFFSNLLRHDEASRFIVRVCERGWHTVGFFVPLLGIVWLREASER